VFFLGVYCWLVVAQPVHYPFTHIHVEESVTVLFVGSY